MAIGRRLAPLSSAIWDTQDTCEAYVLLEVNLREFACQLTSSWPLARVERRVWAALPGHDLANPLNPVSLVLHTSVYATKGHPHHSQNRRTAQDASSAHTCHSIPCSLRDFARHPGPLRVRIWPPAREEGRVWAAPLEQDPANPPNPPNPVNPVNPLSVPECVIWNNATTRSTNFYEKGYSGTMRSPKCP